MDNASGNTRSVIKVPRALRTEFEMPIAGMTNVPIRTVIVLFLAAFPCFALIVLPGGFVFERAMAALVIMSVALALSYPKLDGIWIGTQYFYRLLSVRLPNSSRRGEALRAIAKWTGDVIYVVRMKKVKALHSIPYVAPAFRAPYVTDVVPGAFCLNHGGWRGVLAIEGPIATLGGASYTDWSVSLMGWISSLNTPAQIYAEIEHYDPDSAVQAFDRNLAPGIPRSPLLDDERGLRGEMAQASFKVKSYLVFDPMASDATGMPFGSSLHKWSNLRDTNYAQIDTALIQAERTSGGFGITVERASEDQIRNLLGKTPLGAEQTVATERAVQVRGDDRITRYHIPYVVMNLPANVYAGLLVDALMQSRCQALINLTLFPVSRTHARKRLQRTMKARNAVAQDKGGAEIEDSMAAQESQELLMQLVQGMRPIMHALSVSVYAFSVEDAEEAAERFYMHMSAAGFELVHARQPGLLPILACSPGMPPLRRGLSMTTHQVCERILPVLGTPFDDQEGPLVGWDVFTGAPAYWDCWQQVNHNLLVLAEQGAGKSVAFKTLLYRHYLQGTNFCVLDPENEYRQLVAAVGGEYHELGQGGAALNAFAVAKEYPADKAASMITTVLSVLAGNSFTDAQGKPIRRLPTEDQYWMHMQLLRFFQQLRTSSTLEMPEPTLKDFIDYLDRRIPVESRHAEDQQRGERIRERLGFYTTGKLGDIFDRRSTFTLGNIPVGIGFKSLASEYGASLTPALAVVLTAVMGVMDKVQQRFLLVLDEAHYLTGDPDAGQVLDSIIRRGRKHATGVWMASQKLSDFLDTPLGKTLVATTSTSLILGCAEDERNLIAERFRLSAEEAAVLHPMSPGRGVLLTDRAERSAVLVVPSNVLFSLINTRPSIVERG